MKGDSGSPSPWKWKGVWSNFQRKEDSGFSLPSIFEGNRQKGKQVAVVEAGGGVGVGCGVGLGFGVVGGAGHGGWAWNHLHLVFGVGLGCGVGLGLGIGQGIGYGFCFDSLDSYFSDEKPISRDRNLFQI